jgi:fructose-specific phosphotransferase system IIC component
MTFKQIGSGTIMGLVSGTLLGLFLKWMQVVTGTKVYVLLLNVDFIPLFSDKDLPEWIEFLFHLVISCVIGIVFVYMMERLKVSSSGSWLLSLVITVPTVFLYFPLSYLAIKDVPGLMDGEAIILWTAGHLLYALSLPPLYNLSSERA